MHAHACGHARAHTHTYNHGSVLLWHYDPNTKVIDRKIEPPFWLHWEFIFHEFIFHGVSAALNEMLFSVMWLTAYCSVSRLHCSGQIETLWDSNTDLTAAGNINKKMLAGAGGQCYYHRMKFHKCITVLFFSPSCGLLWLAMPLLSHFLF